MKKKTAATNGPSHGGVKFSIEAVDVETADDGGGARVLVSVDEATYRHLKEGRDSRSMIAQANEAITDQIRCAVATEAAFRQRYPDLAEEVGLPEYVKAEVSKAEEAARRQFQPAMIVFVNDAPKVDSAFPDGRKAVDVEVRGAHGAVIGWAFRGSVGESEPAPVILALNAAGASYWKGLRAPKFEYGPGFASSWSVIITEGAIYGVAE